LLVEKGKDLLYDQEFYKKMDEMFEKMFNFKEWGGILWHIHKKGYLTVKHFMLFSIKNYFKNKYFGMQTQIANYFIINYPWFFLLTALYCIVWENRMTKDWMYG